MRTVLTKRELLGFIAEETSFSGRVAPDYISSRLHLSPDATTLRLRRLWQERLIEPARARTPRLRFRLLPGERVFDLPFRITDRGAARLRWYEEQERPLFDK